MNDDEVIHIHRKKIIRKTGKRKRKKNPRPSKMKRWIEERSIE